MDKLQIDKLTEIKAEYARVEEMYIKNPEMRDKYDQAHGWIGYLLQLVKTQAQDLKEANKEVDFWRISAENQQKNNFTLLEKIEAQTQTLEEAKDIVEGLYQIIQREDLTSTDMKEADVAYGRFNQALTQV